MTSTLTQSHIEQALLSCTLPHLNQNPLVADAVKAIAIDDGKVSIAIELGFPAASLTSAIEAAIVEAVGAISAVTEVSVEVGWAIASIKSQRDMPAMDQVKNIIAVASGKGGVGKSTTSVNLALALVREGARVGLLDADIYGPSQQLMLGIAEDYRPGQEGKFLLPVEAHGLKTMSMGYLVNEQTPMVWRGPMAGGALTQLLGQTLWGELDYLIIDMPPGTGDIQLTLSQKAVVAGAVIVTTPQDIALLDARKGIEMFHKVEVPVLGVIENMATHICSQCGHQEPIFGEGGAARIAGDYQVPVLGSLPLSIKIRQQVDAGAPSVIAEPEGTEAQLYGEIARDMAVKLSQQGTADEGFPNIVVKDD